MYRFLSILLLTLVAACGRDADARDGRLTRERFIEVNVALRQLGSGIAEPGSPRVAEPSPAHAGESGAEGDRPDTGEDGTETETADTTAALPDDPASQRAAILASFGVTEDQMRAFIKDGRHSPRELKAIWDEIARRMEPKPYVPDAPQPAESFDHPRMDSPAEDPEATPRPYAPPTIGIDPDDEPGPADD
jgi:hypothetical protein